MKINELIFGAPLDPLAKDTKRHIALVAFLAWIGLGDGEPDPNGFATPGQRRLE